MIDLDRITHPLRLARGSHELGSGKGCAMNVISYINGDTKITDYPQCSARPLARLVQSLNDRLAGADGFLSPENSVLVLDLGWLTVGTAGTPRTVVWRWLSDLLVDPEHGAVKYATSRGAEAIRRVAALCALEAEGERVPVTKWREARAAAAAAAAANAAANAYPDAYAAANAAAYAAADAYANAAAYAAANAAANAAAYANAGQITFTSWAINHWRQLAKLDTPTDIDTQTLNTALAEINN